MPSVSPFLGGRVVALTEKTRFGISYKRRLANVDFPAPLGAVRMISLPFLLNVLHLFPHLFKFFLSDNNMMSNNRITRFGTNGIQFPVNFLA